MRPQNNPRFSGNRPISIRPRSSRKPKPKWRFRWAFVLVPAAVFLALWIISGIEPAGTWDDLMDFMKVRNRQRYTLLACLGLVIVAIVATARVLRPSEDDQE